MICPKVLALPMILCLALPASPARRAEAGETPIARTIDAARRIRPFPDLVGYRNTSIQKAPAPILAELSERELGRPKVTRCWLNLDEMWDYRTRKFDFDFQIGLDRYAGVKEKFRESWNWERETKIHFNEYLKAFGRHSDDILLCIRRYERDILDGKLGITMDDWKMIFKAAVRHAKTICPNVRYIEVCNEYGCSGFIGCTHDEYYRFYRLAYQAVNEVNAEMKLTAKDRILVGGPNAVRAAMEALNRFFENFRNDPAADKRLDFVTWHEYHDRYGAIAHRERDVNAMLAAHGLAKGLPMFITEHDPYHPKAGAREYNLINGACLVKSLYFTSVHSPNVKIMPWVQYHDRDIQTRFMWFDGPNEPDTKIDQIHMLPAGCSMKFLAMHEPWEVVVENAIDRDELVLASVGDDGLVVEVVNYGPPRDVRLRVGNLPKVFTTLGEAPLTVRTWLIDQKHSNRVTNPDYPGGIQMIAQRRVRLENGSLTLIHEDLQRHGLVLWQVTPGRTGKTLHSPVKVPIARQ